MLDKGSSANVIVLDFLIAFDLALYNIVTKEVEQYKINMAYIKYFKNQLTAIKT